MRLCLPMVVGKKLSNFFELIKPMIECKFELIQARSNNVFELATQEEVDKLAGATTGSKSSDKQQFSDDINLDEVKSSERYIIYFIAQ